MSRMRVVVLVLAIGSAILAAVLAKGFIGARPEAEVVEINKVETVDVLVASRDLEMGSRLAGDAVRWKAWPKENIGPGMITRDSNPDATAKLEPARVRLAIFEGEPIFEKKLVIPGQSGFMSAVLPKGMRAISVAISERSSAGGFILPNDRVDVILTRKLENPQGGDKIVVSETVLTDVRVLAVNQTYKQTPDDEKVAVEEGKTATLELDPRQTEVIAMVESAGELSLSLRSIAENEGKPLEEQGPELAARFRGEGGSGGNTLFVRYGFESLSSNR